MPARSKARVVAIEGRTPSPQAMRKLAGQKAHIYYFQSPKNHRRFIFCDQLTFYLAILLEAELNVTSYRASQPEDSTPGPMPCLNAVLCNGEQLSYIVCYETEARLGVVGTLAELSAPLADGQCKIVTAQFIRDQHIQIENWLLMCANMSRAKNYSCIDEAEAMFKDLRRLGTVNLWALIQGAEIDEARMLAAVARALQAGTVICDTATKPFTYNSALALRTGVL